MSADQTGEVTADDVMAALSLEPHPEGGWFRQTFEDVAVDHLGRARSTAIYYLLRAGETSARHRIDAVEVWHFYAGEPLELVVETDPGDVVRHVLGPDVTAGQRPQVVVPVGAWQSGRPLGAWTLVGCTVAPGFRFDGFELA